MNYNKNVFNKTYLIMNKFNDITSNTKKYLVLNNLIM